MTEEERAQRRYERAMRAANRRYHRANPTRYWTRSIVSERNGQAATTLQAASVTHEDGKGEHENERP